MEKPHPLTPLVRAWVLVVAAAWAVGRELLNGGDGLRLPPLTWVSVAGAVIVVVLIGFAYLDWRATSFIVDHDELHIETGVFTKTSQRIRFDRIQSVDITEPFAARLLGLAEITIDVGAEGGHKLRYLSRSRAAAVRDYLLARAHGIRPVQLTQHVRTGTFTHHATTDEVLVRVPPQRLVLGAFLSHELLFVLLPLLLIGVALGLDQRARLAIAVNPWLLLGVLLPALGGLWSFLLRRVVGQWNYAFLRSGPGLKITRGLTSLTSQSVPRHRIQSLRIAQPLWWRRLGLYRVNMAVLGNHGLAHDEDQAGTTSILLPVGTRTEVELVLATIWPGLRLDDIDVRPSPERARWLQPISHGWVGWGYDESVLLTRAGWLTRVQMIVPHARVQSLAIAQGPLRRRLGLATVGVHTTQILATSAARNISSELARTLLRDETTRARTARLGTLLEEPRSS
ncbi:MAG: PH domain-containing protein [Micropruina sp.]